MDLSTEKMFLSFKWKVKHDTSFSDSDMKNKLFMSKKMIEYFDLVFLLLENYEFWKYEMNKTEKTSLEKKHKRDFCCLYPLTLIENIIYSQNIRYYTKLM